MGSLLHDSALRQFPGDSAAVLTAAEEENGRLEAGGMEAARHELLGPDPGNLPRGGGWTPPAAGWGKSAGAWGGAADW